MSECYELSGYARFPIGSERIITLDYLCLLEGTSETIASVTVTKVTTDGNLTTGTPQVNSAAITDSFGNTIAIGQAIQFMVSTTATETYEYILKVTSTTTTDGQVIVDYIKVEFYDGE